MVSFEKLDSFDYDSDKDGYGSGSPGTCAFSFCSGKSAGHVNGVGSGDFFPTGIDSIGDAVLLVMFIPRGVKSKGGRLIGGESKCGQLIESFWRPKS